MEKTQVLHSETLNSPEPTSIISKLYCEGNRKEYLSEWTIENMPIEKKTSNPVLFI
jgi:hypothetical protein